MQDDKTIKWIRIACQTCMCVANTEDTVVQVITDAKQYRVGPFNWRTEDRQGSEYTA